ncbi:MAG: response regulator [Chloroflexi bacterium]|nr:response regulator [Chloroflexota bacterium]MDA8187685.1 response regulator [Dehalococcoidales bacterium]
MAQMPKILVIDDDPDLVESWRLVLEASSYSVVSAGSSEEGMQKTEREKPDLVLLDVMMPEGTEGFHFVWKLRNHRQAALRQIPIIVVTSIHRTTDIRLHPDQPDAAYEPGEFLPVQGFLDKPVEPSELVKWVGEVISKGWKPS